MGDFKPQDLYDSEEAEEALSLSDFPLNAEKSKSEEFALYGGRSSSETSDCFEFLSDQSIEMCPAEEIISCGRVVPLKDQYSHFKPYNTAAIKNQPKNAGFRRRSESLSELETRNSNSTKTRFMRSSHSLDYQKLHRSSSSEPEIELNSSRNSTGKATVSVRNKSPRSRWYLLTFGLLKFPPEMELRDIKNRQVRRNPGTVMFPSVETDGKVAVNRSGAGGKVSWGLLNMLSCKDHASVAVVTATFGRMPRV